MQLLPISTLRALPVDEQDALARESVKLQKRATTATEEHRSSFPAVGKLVCVIEERLEQLKCEGKIGKRTSLNEYWEGITKTKGEVSKLNNHALSCSVAFSTYVRSDLMSEPDYDKNPGQNLEIAASISTAVKGDLTNTAVHAAAEVLRDRPKDAAKKLRDILATVKDVKSITAEKARELIASIMACGHLTTVVIPAVGGEIAHLTDPQVAESAFHGLNTALGMFEVNMAEDGVTRRFTDAVIDGWIGNDAKAKSTNQPVGITHGAAPVAVEVPVVEVPEAQAPASPDENATSEAPQEEPQPFISKRERRRLAAEAAANGQLQAA